MTGIIPADAIAIGYVHVQHSTTCKKTKKWEFLCVDLSVILIDVCSFH